MTEIERANKNFSESTQRYSVIEIVTEIKHYRLSRDNSLEISCTMNFADFVILKSR